MSKARPRGRGFQHWPTELHKEVSRKGGKAVGAEQRSFSQDPALAVLAGRRRAKLAAEARFQRDVAAAKAVLALDEPAIPMTKDGITGRSYGGGKDDKK
jgi:general stress protein YciG